jgi:hypothetical protein
VILAYIDPGLGAMVVQAIAAAVFGALFFLRNLRHAVVRGFQRLLGRHPSGDPKQAVETTTPVSKE